MLKLKLFHPLAYPLVFGGSGFPFLHCTWFFSPSKADLKLLRAAQFDNFAVLVLPRCDAKTGKCQAYKVHHASSQAWRLRVETHWSKVVWDGPTAFIDIDYIVGFAWFWVCVMVFFGDKSPGAVSIGKYHSNNYTSRAARGGGGSFKNRKRIGEIGCCESRMTKRKHWWIWLTFELSNWLTD